MYVLQNWTFTPGNEGEGTIEVPGVYTIEQFAHITNLTRNIPLFDSEEHEATITLSDDGVNSTLTLRQNTSFCDPNDELQIVMYDLFSDPAATSNVAVTNFPATQDVSGTVSVDNFPTTTEISNNTGNPVPVIQGWNVADYDYLSLGYTDGNVSSVVYKQGGAAGTTVATLTLAYDGSGNLLSVTKS